jgi:hypothetical protein
MSTFTMRPSSRTVITLSAADASAAVQSSQHLLELSFGRRQPRWIQPPEFRRRRLTLRHDMMFYPMLGAAAPTAGR